jgi:hypothetical protein
VEEGGDDDAERHRVEGERQHLQRQVVDEVADAAEGPADRQHVGVRPERVGDVLGLVVVEPGVRLPAPGRVRRGGHPAGERDVGTEAGSQADVGGDAVRAECAGVTGGSGRHVPSDVHDLADDDDEAGERERREGPQRRAEGPARERDEGQ